MRARILVVEDDPEISQLIAMYLTNEGVEVLQAASGEEALEITAAEDPELIILDLNLPGMDGYEFLQKFRATSAIPVVVVSARVDDSDMILGFGYGADDFVPKPFSPKVLTARIRAHLRREQRLARSAPPLSFGDYVYEAENLVLKKGGVRVRLSPKELALLDELVQNEGRPVNQDALYSSVWGNEFGDLTTVSVHIQRLRKKIEENPSDPRYIRTVYGFGYMFSRTGEDATSH